jgi:hypothetical protein
MNLRSIANLLAVLGLLSGCTLLPPKNYTRGISNRCEVHGVDMERAVVPICYGLPAIPLDQDYLHALDEATKSAFPHAQDHVEGGCIVKLGAPKRAAIYVCPSCRSAKQDWMGHHHPKPTPNHPAAGNARSALLFAIGRQWPGVPEPVRSAAPFL